MSYIKKGLINLKNNFLLFFSAIFSVILLLMPDIDILFAIIGLIFLVLFIFLITARNKNTNITKRVKIGGLFLTSIFCVFEAFSAYNIWSDNVFALGFLKKFNISPKILLFLFILLSALSSYFVYFVFTSVLSRIKINKKEHNNDYSAVIIFTLTCVVFFSISLLIIKYNENGYDFFFGADCYRARLDLIGDNKLGFCRVVVHPLFLILITPFVLMINLIVRNDLIAMLVVESISAAIGTVYLYKSLDLLLLKKYLKIVFTCIYALSFSLLVFVSIPETFVFSGMFLSGFFYWIIKKTKSDEKHLSSDDYLSMIILGCVCFGCTITNYVVFIIGIIFLLICTDDFVKNKILNFFRIFFTSIFSIVYLCVVQTKIWGAPVFYYRFVNSFIGKVFKLSQFKVLTGETSFMDFGFSLEKLKEEFLGMIASVIPTAVRVNDDNLLCLNDYNKFAVFLLLVTAVILFIGLIYLHIKKHNKYAILPVVLLSFNGVLHFFYGSNESFLYSQHYLYLIIVAIALLVDSIPISDNKNMKKIISVIALLMIANNIYRFIQVIILNKSKYKVELFNSFDLIRYALIFSFVIIILSGIYILMVKKAEKRQFCCNTLNIYGLFSVLLSVIIFFVPNQYF